MIFGCLIVSEQEKLIESKLMLKAIAALFVYKPNINRLLEFYCLFVCYGHSRHRLFKLLLVMSSIKKITRINSVINSNSRVPIPHLRVMEAIMQVIHIENILKVTKTDFKLSILETVTHNENHHFYPLFLD